jgi:hypothetical protein
MLPLGEMMPDDELSRALAQRAVDEKKNNAETSRAQQLFDEHVSLIRNRFTALQRRLRDRYGEEITTEGEWEGPRDRAYIKSDYLGNFDRPNGTGEGPKLGLTFLSRGKRLLHFWRVEGASTWHSSSQGEWESRGSSAVLRYGIWTRGYVVSRSDQNGHAVEREWGNVDTFISEISPKLAEAIKAGR